MGLSDAGILGVLMTYHHLRRKTRDIKKYNPLAIRLLFVLHKSVCEKLLMVRPLLWSS